MQFATTRCYEPRYPELRVHSSRSCHQVPRMTFDVTRRCFMMNSAHVMHQVVRPRTGKSFTENICFRLGFGRVLLHEQSSTLRPHFFNNSLAVVAFFLLLNATGIFRISCERDKQVVGLAEFLPLILGASAT